MFFEWKDIFQKPTDPITIEINHFMSPFSKDGKSWWWLAYLASWVRGLDASYTASNFVRNQDATWMGTAAESLTAMVQMERVE